MYIRRILITLLMLAALAYCFQPSAPPAVPARSALAAALAQTSANNTITLTKTLIGPASGPFTVTVAGPAGYLTQVSISPDTPTVLTSLASGLYTVSEVSPGPGWVTTYTVGTQGVPASGPGTPTSGPAVVNLTALNPAPVAPAPLTGRVYRDYNSDGQLTANGVITDTGVPHVTVTAYAATAAACGSTVSDSTGNYTLTPTCPGPWQLVFQNLPPGYEPASHGAQNATSIQFVTSAPTSNLDLTILRPGDYSQANVRWFLARHQRTSSSNTLPSLQLFADADALPGPGGFYTVPPNPGKANFTTLLQRFQSGNLFGLAWARTTRTLYAAFMDRGWGFMGPSGESTIYSIKENGTFATWLNLDTLLGADTASAAIIPAILINSSPETNRPNDTGHIGLGFIRLSADERSLYAINLFSKELYVIPVGATGQAPTLASQIARFPLPVPPNCAGNWSDLVATGVPRPYRAALGVAVHPTTGHLFVTETCTGPAAADLVGYVYEVDPTDTSPAASDFVQVLAVPLNLKYPNSNTTSSTLAVRPWFTATATSVSINGSNTVPWLGDLVFDLRPDDTYGLILAIRNRVNDLIPQATVTSAGSVLRACNPTSNTPYSAWTLEANGLCQTYTSSVVYPTALLAATSPQNRFFNSIGREGSYSEGTLALIPGRDVAAIGIDAILDQATHGVTWLNSTTGHRLRDVQITKVPNTSTNLAGFHKANNFGDLEPTVAEGAPPGPEATPTPTATPVSALPAYALGHTLTGVGGPRSTEAHERLGAPVTYGQLVTFTIFITNTSATPLTALTLQDTYSTLHLEFVTASHLPVSLLDDGQLDWPNLLTAQVLPPGAAITLTTVFRALYDTSALPTGQAVNRVRGSLAQSTSGPVSSPTTSADASILILEPTALTLANLSSTYTHAQDKPGVLVLKATITWSSIIENNLSAYTLLRIDLATNQVVTLTAWLPALHSGSPQGDHYTYLDSTVAPDHAYRYFVGVIRLDNTISYYPAGNIYTGPPLYLPWINVYR